MMKRSLASAGILLLMIFLFLGCGKSKEKEMADKELVRVNDASISLEEFHQLSEGQSLEGKMRLLNEKGLRDFLENYVVTRELLYQEAKKKGFEKKQEIRMKVENFKRMMLIDALMEEMLKGKTEISETEIQQYYKENQDQFTEPLEIKIRHIFVTSEPALKEVLTTTAQQLTPRIVGSLHKRPGSSLDEPSEFGPSSPSALQQGCHCVSGSRLEASRDLD
jgi:hypothetical protein